MAVHTKGAKRHGWQTCDGCGREFNSKPAPKLDEIDLGLIKKGIMEKQDFAQPNWVCPHCQHDNNPAPLRGAKWYYKRKGHLSGLDK